MKDQQNTTGPRVCFSLSRERALAASTSCLVFPSLKDSQTNNSTDKATGWWLAGYDPEVTACCRPLPCDVRVVCSDVCGV